MTARQRPEGLPASVISTAKSLATAAGRLRFGPPVSHIYNPLAYAWDAHAAYLGRYAATPKEVLLVGMNPGPFGMVQTGVPFGDVAMVRGWLQISAQVARPPLEHPKRPVLGFDCRRGEVSGARFWGWARDRFKTPERFFSRFFVWNYCPLAFLEASGRNLTPDKLRTGEATPLFSACDLALQQLAAQLVPRYVIGVGAFAEGRVRAALAGRIGLVFGRIPHPSPANPAANRGWAALAEQALHECGIPL